jgi:hypothetical protein
MAEVGEPVRGTQSEHTAIDAKEDASPAKSQTSNQTPKTNPYADINLDDLADDDVKLTCCQALMAWEKRPIWTPKWVLLWLGVYCIWFTSVTVMMYFTIGQVTEIEVNYRDQPKCSKKPDQTDSSRVKELRCVENDHTPQQNAPMVEHYEVTVPEDMPSPIYMYYEITGFHQNHMRFVKSSGNWGVTQMLMTGHCMSSQNERSTVRGTESRCEESGHGDGAQASAPVIGSAGWMGGSTHLFAMYKYWHPFSDIGLFTKGCFPWWSTKDQDCVADPREGGWLISLNVAPRIYDLTSSKAGCKDGPKREACAMSQSGLAQTPRYPVGWANADGTSLPANQWYHTDKDGKDGTAKTQLDTLPISNRPADEACIGGNRVFYPCGLAAKYMFNDTFALIDEDGLVKLDERAEKIAFDYDYLYSIRNMDPEEKFDSGKNRISGTATDAKKFNGYRFYDVMQFWLIHRLPPMVCANDPLRLASPNVHPDYSTGDVIDYPYAACTNYKEFSFSASKNKASCAYMTDAASPSAVFQNVHRIGILGDGPLDPSVAANVGATVSGCGLNEQIPNQAGWGVENSHFLVWNRPSGLNWFKKKYANIDKKWKKGKKLQLAIANRYNLKGVTGGKDAEDDQSIREGYGATTSIKKKVWFQNKSWVGGYSYAYYIPWIFGLMATLSWLTFIIILVVHVKDPRRLAKIQFMDWKTQG